MNIDDLLPEDDASNKINEQMETIRRTHGKTFPLNYAMTWIIANQIVQRYYGRLGIDAIPQWRDNFGWSQFNLTRATSCEMPYDAAEESQRYVLFDAIAVNWKHTSGGGNAHSDVANSILVQHQHPAPAVMAALEHLALDEQAPFDHSKCLHGPHAYSYTKLYQVVTDLICRAPEAVGRRELVVDLDAYGKKMEEVNHPLRKLGMAQPGVTRDWVEIFHVPTNTRLFIQIFTGDILYTDPDETPHKLDYPGWNELNEEQLTAYFAGMLRIAG